MRAASLACVAVLCALMSGDGASAWGPHAEIAIAGAKALDKDDPMLAYLRNDLNLLGSVAWMGDNASGNGVVKIGNMKLYARDVAFSPGWHEFGHGHGEPGETGYEPLFRRVLQAIHTETPANAIGWLGQLIHVTQDTGCPPHAVGCNDARHACEGWIDAAKIDIAGYVPQLLGETDDMALQGYLARITKLQECTRSQAARALPLAAQGNKEECVTVMMESALESARITADLLHTLGSLQAKAGPVEGMGGLVGTVTTQPGTDTVVAKIILLGTDYSTLADADGHYEFRNLPPAQYHVAVMKPASRPQTAQAIIEAGRQSRLDIDLPSTDPPDNLLRNGDFSVSWMCKDVPDGWYKTGNLKPPTVQWYSEPITVKLGQTLRLTANWNPGVEGEIKIVCERTAQEPLTAGVHSSLFTIPASVDGFRGLAWVSACTTTGLSATFGSVAVTLEPAPMESPAGK